MSWLDRERAEYSAAVIASGTQFRLALPERYQDAEQTKLPLGVQPVVKQYLGAFWTSVARGVAPAFIGRARTGKTYAASVIAKAAGPKLRTKFISAPDFLSHLEAIRFSHEQYTKVMGEVSQYPLIVLDDLFMIGRTGAKLELAATILENRFQNLHPTIITANLDLPAGRETERLAELFGGGIARRIEDGAEGYLTLLS